MRRRAGSRLAAVLIVAAIAATVVHFYFLAEEEAVRIPAPVPPPGPLAGTAVPPADATPTPGEEAKLEGSDEVVRQLGSALSAHPEFAKWLAHDELIRRFVASVVNVAEGAIPRKPLAFLEPEQDFSAIERKGVVLVDPQTFRRYDVAAEIVASLDAQGSARLYRELEPRIESAYRELGYPDRDFDETLAKAIRSLLAVPILEGEIRLDPRVTTHRYADNRLEELTPAQKLLLRMGPENVRKVQGKLREVAAALGLDPEKAPEPRV